MKYQTEITGWGKNALAFLENPETNFIILFDEDTPPELAELSVLHIKNPLLGEPSVGDTVVIADKVFTITAIGDEAVGTLRKLGHCTFVFKGFREPERPGCIMLEGEEDLKAEDIKKGVSIEIH